MEKMNLIQGDEEAPENNGSQTRKPTAMQEGLKCVKEFSFPCLLP